MILVRRVYVEKKDGLRQEAESLCRELQSVLGIKSLLGVRVIHRYDVEGLDGATFDRAVRTVFSEPQVDEASLVMSLDAKRAETIFAVEALPGQFDQRADSAAACIQLMTRGARPVVRTADIYRLSGNLSAEDVERVKRYLINPVETREASRDVPETLQADWEPPAMVETVDGFTALDDAGLSELLNRMGLAMDTDDLKFLQAHFRDEERRDPTVTEIRVVDTYWSDHCRHTTFSTRIDGVEIVSPEVRAAYERYLSARKEVYGEREAVRPQTLMDIATVGAKVLKRRGLLRNLDESEEINACSVRVTVTVDGKPEEWLLMFKNETHNHPTEIEPFGGAATCIGGCIRDPLSGRAWVYQAMRVTGCGDPRVPVGDTLPGKLPQRKLAQTAAAGYSSYGNQIGLATGLVSEVYHPGYVAKHMEIGAVVGAAPAANVVRERPAPGDVVILLGGRTGRDGIGGATGSSKSHNQKSLTTMASEVQKGNAPEERKLQRLFRDASVTRLIKRCNDFGAGGVSVAIGELADGLEINLDAVRKKYEGLDGTELAISESQERMAVVVAPGDVEAFIEAAERENLEAYPVAEVTESPRMVMKWQGATIVDLSRAFLNTNGAEKHIIVKVADSTTDVAPIPGTLQDMAADLRVASRRGLAERFDSTVGAGSVLMPFGGVGQRTPAQVMAALFPVLPGQTTEDCSVMSWGFDPESMSANPFDGARKSVIVSLAKLCAAGCDYRDAYLTFQEYFEKLRQEPTRWGKPFAALLGALEAQLELGVAAIGGKDSMSGSFLEMDVPPTLVSFAIAPAKAGDVLSPEFKRAGKKHGHPVYLFGADGGETVDYAALKAAWDAFHALCQAGKVKAAWAVEYGVAEAVMKMSFGNRVGFCAEEEAVSAVPWYSPCPGAIVAELAEEVEQGTLIGATTLEPVVAIGDDRVSVTELLSRNEGVLEDVYPNRAETEQTWAPILTDTGSRPKHAPKVGVAVPRVLIPVFPGTNCEYDSARAVMDAGLQAEIFVINNQSARGVEESANRFAAKVAGSQIIFIPGGFSGGDEPDGSGKFITAFFRNPGVSDAVMELLKARDGLILGVCNGFQALIKLGLVPYGEIRDMSADCPTLSYNVIGRHQSRIVRTRVASRRSPWLSRVREGDIVNVPISHGEGRFLCPHDLLTQLGANGQIATQYVDLKGNPSMNVEYNPNGSVWAVEGLLSPDGRVFGKMGHSERIGAALYRNVPGDYDLGLFDSAKDYFNV
ncbi:MAG: phosphoribosylformylglycinamidine synthase [Oscillibacter sp.]|nr:phosphoribosylformylglycinamidine synthase [Oscillibacter sp.]